MKNQSVPNFLQDEGLRLLLFGGKGGVGKTTCAAAAALDQARRRPACSFLLVSTDPAHSLLDCFAGEPPLANLTLLEIDPQACLSRFKQQHEAQLRTIALRGTFLDPADVARLLDLSLPGLDETMALLEILAWVREDRYACIVVDTAPAGHTLRLLALPALMRHWVNSLDAMLAKYRYMACLYRGAYDKEEVDLYLENTLADIKKLLTLLRSPKRCRFVPVMLAERLSLHVTRLMLDELAQLGLTVREVVVNRLLMEPRDCPVCQQGATQQVQEMAHLTGALSMQLLWGMPLCLEEVRGTALLLDFWSRARPLAQAARSMQEALASPAATRLALPQPMVSQPVPLPPATVKLLLFAGKGGVGKTTLACASALYLAEVGHAKEILLVSIDPAHSLGACLGHAAGARASRLLPGLSVMEVDAQAEFVHLKKDYAAALKQLFEQTDRSSGVDLAFDRQVMQRLLDVAPAGLDEMLALTRIVTLMDQQQYDLFILDTAPTGHLLRFLEMPALMDAWLKTFFALFLKYQKVFWLPRISSLMVDLSKRLKVFRALLTDARQAALLAVTIPAELAFAETRDLVAACERLGLAVPMLLVNLVTPPSSCPTCSALRRHELPLLARYAKAYAGRPLAQVCRQSAPHGVNELLALGRALYGASRR